MSDVINLDHKWGCDINTDARVNVIRSIDCVTQITANPNGMLI